MKLLGTLCPRWFILGLLLLMTGSAFAQQQAFYVDPISGNDANTGGLSDPFQSVSQALMSASNGDIIRMVAGYYGETIIVDKQVAFEAFTDPTYSITTDAQVQFDGVILSEDHAQATFPEVNLILNGQLKAPFNAGNEWNITTTATDWQYDAATGRLTHPSFFPINPLEYTAFDFKPNTWYELRFEVRDITPSSPSSIRPGIGSVMGPTITTDGRYILYLRTDATGGRLHFDPTIPFLGSLDNISVTQLGITSSNITVTTNANSANKDSRILLQDAVSLAGPSAFINISSGRFPYFLDLINRPDNSLDGIQINGFYAGRTGVDPLRLAANETLIRIPEGVSAPNYTTGTYNATLMHINGVRDLIIRGLVLDGSNTATPFGYGANGSNVHASIGVTDFTYTFGYSSRSLSGLYFVNNIIRNFGEEGIYLDPGSLTSADVSIQGNLIQNIVGISGTGAGIMLFNNTYGSIANNTLRQVRLGMQYQNHYGANTGITKNEIANNTIEFYRAGLYVNNNFSNADSLVVRNNTFRYANGNYAGGATIASIHGIMVESQLNNRRLNVRNNTVDLTAIPTATKSVVGNIIGIQVAQSPSLAQYFLSNTLTSPSDLPAGSGTRNVGVLLTTGLGIAGAPNAQPNRALFVNTDIAQFPIGIYTLHETASAGIINATFNKGRIVAGSEGTSTASRDGVRAYMVPATDPDNPTDSLTVSGFLISTQGTGTAARLSTYFQRIENSNLSANQAGIIVSRPVAATVVNTVEIVGNNLTTPGLAYQETNLTGTLQPLLAANWWGSNNEATILGKISINRTTPLRYKTINPYLNAADDTDLTDFGFSGKRSDMTASIYGMGFNTHGTKGDYCDGCLQTAFNYVELPGTLNLNNGWFRGIAQPKAGTSLTLRPSAGTSVANITTTATGPATINVANGNLVIDDKGETTATLALGASVFLVSSGFHIDLASHTGGSSTGHIAGQVNYRHTPGTTVTLPLGDGTNYQPFTISPSADIVGPNWFSASFVSGVSDNLADNGGSATIAYPSAAGSPATRLLDGGYWTVTPNVPLTAGKVDIQAVLSGSTNTTGMLGFAIVKRNNGTSPWGRTLNEKASTKTGTIVGAASDAITTFSDFGVAASPTGQLGGGALPVRWLAVQGQFVQGAAHVLWATATETNNREFVVERSWDGHAFEAIGTVAGAGTSTQVNNYTFTDRSWPATAQSAYYRIRQVDFDNTGTYSAIVEIKRNLGSVNANEAYWVLSPNPVQDAASFDITLVSPEVNYSSEHQLTVVGNSGTIQLQVKGPLANITRQMRNWLTQAPSGSYHLIITSGTHTQRIQLIRL